MARKGGGEVQRVSDQIGRCGAAARIFITVQYKRGVDIIAFFMKIRENI